MSVWEIGGHPVVNNVGIIYECEDCPCVEPIDCSAIDTTPLDTGLEISYEVNDITLTATGTCNCFPIATSGVLTFADSFTDGQGVTRRYSAHELLGCSRCRTASGGPDNQPCYMSLQIEASCESDTVFLQAFLYVHGNSGIEERITWRLRYQDSFGLADVNAGQTVSLPLFSFETSASIADTCEPSSYLSSTISITLAVP